MQCFLRPEMSQLFKRYQDLYPFSFNENKFSPTRESKVFFLFLSSAFFCLRLHNSKTKFAGGKFKFFSHPSLPTTSSSSLHSAKKDVELWWIYYRSVIFQTRRKIWQLGVCERKREWLGREIERKGWKTYNYSGTEKCHSIYLSRLSKWVAFLLISINLKTRKRGKESSEWET